MERLFFAPVGAIAPSVGGFEFEWAPDGTFRATASFAEPVRVTPDNEALFQSVRDTLADAVGAGLAQLERTHVANRSRNVEICHRQYGGTVEQWDRYHDAYLEDAAARALRDAEDQARKEDIRREADRQAQRQRCIEICVRHFGTTMLQWSVASDEAICRLSEAAITLSYDSAVAEDARRERAKRIAACVSHFKLRDYSFFTLLDPDTLSRWYSAVPIRFA